jgi:hypothetical protein
VSEGRRNRHSLLQLQCSSISNSSIPAPRICLLKRLQSISGMSPAPPLKRKSPGALRPFPALSTLSRLGAAALGVVERRAAAGEEARVELVLVTTRLLRFPQARQQPQQKSQEQQQEQSR